VSLVVPFAAGVYQIGEALLGKAEALGTTLVETRGLELNPKALAEASVAVVIPFGAHSSQDDTPTKGVLKARCRGGLGGGARDPDTACRLYR